jgi:hypothetical protein
MSPAIGEDFQPVRKGLLIQEGLVRHGGAQAPRLRTNLVLQVAAGDHERRRIAGQPLKEVQSEHVIESNVHNQYGIATLAGSLKTFGSGRRPLHTEPVVA